VLARTELPADRYAIVTALAYLARDLGRHDDADRWLRQRQQLRRDMGRGHLPYAADDYMLIALNLSMAGRHDEAEKALAAAPRFDPIQLPGWRPQKYNDLIREARTRVYLDRGLIDLALRELPARAVDAHDDSAGLVSLRVLRGQAWCASGRPREGLALLQEQIERVGRDAHPHKPELAWLRGRAAECALAAGQREQARGWAEQARKALMALSEVAPFFRGERR
jgi:tetratricopeptide (TPR) repeat protein